MTGMIKKLFMILLVCIMAIANVFAQHVSEHAALEKARQLMQGKSFVAAEKNVMYVKSNEHETCNYYLFNAEGNDGFVIVSADERTPSILGYSAKRSIDLNNIPCNVKWLLNYYDAAIAQIKKTPASAAATTLDVKPEIPTIITTQWGQGDPYNAYCPLYEGERCLTGCVATAMAQVINYNRWPQNATATVPGYMTSTLGISMRELPGKQFSWNNMDNAAVAQLMLYCGQSVYMDYEPSGSGAFSVDVPAALKDIFGYSERITFAARDRYSDEKWNEMAYNELQKGRPVLYFGNSPSDGGHAFIVDGYLDGLYHLNWGWDGHCDGYFALNGLDPYDYDGFNYNQVMVLHTCAPGAANDSDDDDYAEDNTGGYEDYVKEYGIHTIDGITYRLYSEFENNRAFVLPYNNEERYKGDIYVPDYVEHQGMKFSVFDIAGDCFSDAPELTSLSVCNSFFFGFNVERCPLLTKLEIRNGDARRVGSIRDCPLLESITYPEDCPSMVLPSNCEKLSSITFKNKYGTAIEYCNSDALSQTSLPALKDIYFASDYPPEFQWGSIPDVNSEIRIHIPQGSLPVYQHFWSQGWNFVEEETSETPVSVKWDYCGTDKDASYGGIVGRGDNDVEFAIRIPAEQLTAYIGCCVTAVEFYTIPRSSNDYQYEDVEYVFVTSPGHDYHAKASVNTIRGTWMRVNFQEPYTITGEELFVGIGRHSILSATWANNDVEPDGMWLRVMGEDYSCGTIPGQWERNAGQQGWNHPLPIRAIIQGERLPNDIVIRAVVGVEDNSGPSYAKASKAMGGAQNMSVVPEEGGFFNLERKGDGIYYVPEHKAKVKSSADTDDNAKKLQFKIVNRSPRLVENVVIDWTIDGKKQDPMTIETALLTNHQEVITIPLPKNTETYYHTLDLDVASIDGEIDEIHENSSKTVEYTSASELYYPRKIVVEEATGTWCGYCPSGIEGIKYMNEHYPDNFIAIAIHDDREMYPGDEYYEPFYSIIESVPSAWINRLELVYPVPYEMENVMKNKGVAMIKAEVAGVAGNHVTVATETEFGFNDNATEYRIAYVVTEDNVGPYYQTNFYSDPSAPDNPDGLLNWWVHQDSQVKILYNDVARGIYDYNGIPGLLPAEVRMGEKYNSEYTLTLPDNVQDAHNASIVTLLLDTHSGEILNADRVSLAQFIEDVYCITYIVDGEVYKTYNIECGSVIELPDAPEKDGYTFYRWEGLPENMIMPYYDLTVTAVYAIRGDVNLDENVNVIDAVDIVNDRLGYESTNFVYVLSDVNRDEQYTITDAIGVVNIMYGAPVSSYAPCRMDASYESLDLSQMNNNTIALYMNCANDYSAFQFDVELPNGIELDAISLNGNRCKDFAVRFNMTDDNIYKVVAYNLANEPFTIGSDNLLTLNLSGANELDEVKLTNIHFSTLKAVDVRFDDLTLEMTTGIQSHAVSVDDVEYNVAGLRVNKDYKGLVIVNGKKVIK